MNIGIYIFSMDFSYSQLEVYTTPEMSSAASNNSQSNRGAGGDEKRNKRESRRANTTRAPKPAPTAAKRSGS
jgi:hypothetical protein